MKSILKFRKGQIWIETVIYTLIAISLIGLVLAFVMPRINKAKDKTAIEQTIDSLNNLDQTIDSVLSAPYNVRGFEFRINRGEMYINSTGDRINFIISDLKEPYSQPNVSIDIGRVNIVSLQNGKNNYIIMTLNYGGIANIEYAGKDELKKLSAASVPYNLRISNLGGSADELSVISIEDSTGR